jgi:hypothetical protein
VPVIYKDIVQGSPQWMEVRVGKPTASQFHRIVTPTGNPSKQAEMYRLELIAERATGLPNTDFKTSWMERGSDKEPEAVAYYEFQGDVTTEKVGFISSDCGRYGASPDRLVGDDGMLEVKIPKPAVHVGYLLMSGAAYEEHRIQVQSQLWVANRKWNDLLSYSPDGMPRAVHRSERDEKFIAKMEPLVLEFCDELERLWKEYLDKYGMPEKPSPNDDEFSREAIIRALKDSLAAVNSGKSA